MHRGTFIAIEGVDKLANSAQIELLAGRLKKDGHQVLCFDFSELHEPAGHFVNQYLSGKYGSQNDVGPYTSSLFFAMNRYHSAEDIRQALDDGKIVLATEFTGSGMAQQGSTFANPEERRGFYIWLDNLDYQMLKLPRPDKSFILRMPVEGLNGQFKSLASTYDDLPQLFPKDFTRVDYVRSGKSMDSQQLHDFIWKFAEPSLPKGEPSDPETKKTLQPSSVYIPEGLTVKTRQKYTDILGQILELRRQLGDSLQESTLTISEYDEVLENLLPVAAYTSPAEHQQALELVMAPKKSNLNRGKVKGTYASPAEMIDLHTIMPRNELDILPNALFATSDLALSQLEEQIKATKYEKKASLLSETCLEGSALKHFNYGFELLVSISTLRAIQNTEGVELSTQTYSPRYGFDVSDALNDNQLERFEHAFELSLKLYSELQAEGLENLAQLTLLRGHKIRIYLQLNGIVLQNLLKTLTSKSANPSARALAAGLVAEVELVHPLASAYYKDSLAKLAS